MLPESPHSLAVAISLALLTGCATTSPRQQADQRAVDSIRQAANRARANPKNAKATKAYARKVGQAWKNGVFKRCASSTSQDQNDAADNRSDSGSASQQDEPHCRAKPTEWTREALKLLKQSARVHTAEAHALYAERGLLLVRAGEIQAAVDEFKHSMQIQPNADAALVLLGYYSGRNEYQRVKQLCRKTTPHIRDTDEKFNFIQTCIDDSGASTRAGALSWATPAQKRFY